ncbi:MAG: hypothetical protein F4X56_03090 [Gammaproteobacteria bacterium]|nr:hypothetical protein [Gammaproteobacteria bacterium]
MIHHSEQGSQRTSKHFLEPRKNANFQVSMGSVGDCCDNAMAESFFTMLRTEVIFRQLRRCISNRATARVRIFAISEGFYTSYRQSSSLGQVSPAKFEVLYYRRVRENGRSKDREWRQS